MSLACLNLRNFPRDCRLEFRGSNPGSSRCEPPILGGHPDARVGIGGPAFRSLKQQQQLDAEGAEETESRRGVLDQDRNRIRIEPGRTFCWEPPPGTLRDASRAAVPKASSCRPATAPLVMHTEDLCGSAPSASLRQAFGVPQLKAGPPLAALASGCPLTLRLQHQMLGAARTDAADRRERLSLDLIVRDPEVLDLVNEIWWQRIE
jgi:hypothetical protein